MGGRGASSGISNGDSDSFNDNGMVAITKMLEPNEQGYMYYVTGTRDVLNNWDEDGNYHPEGIITKERIHGRFDTKEKAISYAKENGWQYISL